MLNTKVVADSTIIRNPGEKVELMILTDGTTIDLMRVSFANPFKSNLKDAKSSQAVNIDGKLVGYISTSASNTLEGNNPTAIYLGVRTFSGVFAGTISQYHGVTVVLPNGETITGYLKGSRSDNLDDGKLRGKGGKVFGSIKNMPIYRNLEFLKITDIKIKGFGNCIITDEKYHPIYKSFNFPNEAVGTGYPHGNVVGFIKVE